MGFLGNIRSDIKVPWETFVYLTYYFLLNIKKIIYNRRGFENQDNIFYQ